MAGHKNAERIPGYGCALFCQSSFYKTLGINGFMLKCAVFFSPICSLGLGCGPEYYDNGI